MIDLDFNPKTFTASKVTKITGVKRTRLQDWIERGWITPSIHKGVGAGDQNIYSETDLYKIAIFLHMVEIGLPRKKVGACLEALSEIFLTINSQDFYKVEYWFFGWTGSQWEAGYIEEGNLSDSMNTLSDNNYVDVILINFELIFNNVFKKMA